MRLPALCFALVMLAGCGPREIHVTMNADNNSGQKGFATLIDKGNSVTVIIETSAPDVEGTQAAHIHDGNCGEVGEKYSFLIPLERLKTPGKEDRFGSTSTEIRTLDGNMVIQFKDFEKGEWLINVHDTREMPIYVSCGEFRAP